MEIAQILKEQRQELEDGLKGKRIVNRELEEVFKNALNSKLIKAVTGVRRCGKSVLIYLMLKGTNFAYMNFDDDRLGEYDSSEILSAFYEIYGKDFKAIFLDEVQNMEKWELFANRLHRAGFNLFITGSNAKLLSKELSTHLTGRHMAIELLPFSFREYLKAKEFTEDISMTKGAGAAKGELNEYLSAGGFPDIVVEKENPLIYLRGIYRMIVERDILGRYSIAYKKTFKEIAFTLLSSPCRSISYNKLKHQFRLKSEHTVKNYVSLMEEAYLIFLLSRFSFKPVEVEKSEKKVYPIDTGLANAVALRSSQEYGRIYENAVAIELLRKKSANPLLDVYYWKSVHDEEVDFVVKEGVTVSRLIQVCYSIAEPGTKTREIRALLKAGKELNCGNLLVITHEFEGEEAFEWFGIKGKVNFIPLWKWLLEGLS